MPHPSSLTPSVGVILPAGGSGTRLGGVRKQFRRLGDAPVLVQTVRAFARLGEVSEIVVAAPEASLDETRTMLSDYGAEARVVMGGATRQASVQNGLRALSETVEVVLVHDAVRPFVSADLISRVIASVRTHGAAAAATPVADTLRRGAQDRFGETVERQDMWAMQTPQGATRARLEAAYAAHAEARTTDEAGLLGLAETPVAIVTGDARNVKVTTPTDWALARALWPSWTSDH